MSKQFLTIPEFENIPYLVHGFGCRTLTQAELRKRFKDFNILIQKQIHSDIHHIIDLHMIRTVADLQAKVISHSLVMQ